MIPTVNSGAGFSTFFSGQYVSSTDYLANTRGDSRGTRPEEGATPVAEREAVEDLSATLLAFSMVVSSA